MEKLYVALSSFLSSAQGKLDSTYEAILVKAVKAAEAAVDEAQDLLAAAGKVLVKAEAALEAAEEKLIAHVNSISETDPTERLAKQNVTGEKAE